MAKQQFAPDQTLVKYEAWKQEGDGTEVLVKTFYGPRQEVLRNMRIHERDTVADHLYREIVDGD